MINNKKGFISMTIMYSFFMVFLFSMLTIVEDYSNKKDLQVFITVPNDPDYQYCTSDDTLAKCLVKMEYKEYRANNDDNAYDHLQDVTLTKGEDSIVYVDYDSAKSKINRSPSSISCPTSTEKGLYAATDDFGTSYYYRGNVRNNYVSFAGLTWRIVRINGDGSIRLILDGDTDPTLQTKFNSESASTWITQSSRVYPNNVGIMYNASATVGVLSQLLTWFNGLSLKLVETDETVTYANKDYIYGNFDDSDILTKLNSFYTSTLETNYANKMKTNSTFCADKTVINESAGLVSTNCSSYGWKFNANICSNERLAIFSSAQWKINFFAGYERFASSSPQLTCQESLQEYSNSKYDCWHAMNLNTYSADGKVKYRVRSDYSKYSYNEGHPASDKACGYAICSGGSKQMYCLNNNNWRGNGIRAEYKALKKLWDESAHGTMQSPKIAYQNEEGIVGNGQLTYPIGLISMDEAVLSGAATGDCSESYSAISSDNYKNYWTSTVAYGDYNNTALNDRYSSEGIKKIIYNNDAYSEDSATYYFVVNSQNNIRVAKNTYEVLYARPVINILDTRNFTGSGTVDDPYVIN